MQIQRQLEEMMTFLFTLESVPVQMTRQHFLSTIVEGKGIVLLSFQCIELLCIVIVAVNIAVFFTAYIYVAELHLRK